MFKSSIYCTVLAQSDQIRTVSFHNLLTPSLKVHMIFLLVCFEKEDNKFARSCTWWWNCCVTEYKQEEVLQWTCTGTQVNEHRGSGSSVTVIIRLLSEAFNKTTSTKISCVSYNVCTDSSLCTKGNANGCSRGSWCGCISPTTCGCGRLCKLLKKRCGCCKSLEGEAPVRSDSADLWFVFMDKLGDYTWATFMLKLDQIVDTIKVTRDSEPQRQNCDRSHSAATKRMAGSSERWWEREGTQVQRSGGERWQTNVRHRTAESWWQNMKGDWGGWIKQKCDKNWK